MALHAQTVSVQFFFFAQNFKEGNEGRKGARKRERVNE